MLNRIGVGIAAGLASALLFAAANASALAAPLVFLAPLPIMIVALGWGLDANAAAIAAAGISMAVIDEPLSGVLFSLTVALPAGLLAGLAALPSIRLFGRRATPPQPPRQAGLGLLALTAAGFAALISAGATAATILYFQGYAAGVAALSELTRSWLDEQVAGGFAAPEGLAPDDVARLIVVDAPAILAAFLTLIFILNLYLAARTAQVSGRLMRPWLDAPTHFRLPAVAGLLALAAFGAWYFAPEPVGAFGGAAAAALAVVFSLQGLATLHALSRRAPGRPALLTALYLICCLAPRWVGPALALFGIVESAVSLRARAGGHVSHRNSKMGP